MSTNVLDLILPIHATDYVRELFNDSNVGLPLEKYFPTQIQNQIKIRFRTNIRTVNPALFRSFDAETPVGKRPASVETIDLILPPIGEKLRLSEEDQHMLLSGGDTDAIVDLLFDDLKTATRDIAARLELARGDLMTDGVMALPIEQGQTLPVDFQTPSSHRPTAGVLWSDTTNATPLSDETAWLLTLATDQLGFGVPVAAVTSTKVARSYLAKNAEYRFAYAGGSANVPSTLTPDQVAAVRLSYGLPPLELEDEIIAGSRVIADNIFNYIPSGGMGTTQMGPTLEARNLAAGGNPHLAGVDVPGLVGVIETDSDPAAVWTKVAGVGMPILSDRNRFFAATVA